MSEEFRAATPRVAAGVLFRDAFGRVLLVKPTYKPGWDIPGGYVEPGESPRQAAIREVDEELGMRPPIGRLLAVDWAPHADEGDKLLFIFEGGSLDLADVTRDEHELGRAEYVSPEDLADHLPDRLHLRLTSALAGLDDVYLEHGRSVEGS